MVHVCDGAAAHCTCGQRERSCVGREKEYGLLDIRQVVPIRYEDDDAVRVIFENILRLKVACNIWSNMREKVRYKYRGGFILQRA